MPNISIKLTILVSAALVIASHVGASSLADRMAAEASESEKVTERIELLTDGDIAKNWYTWLKGEGRGSDTKGKECQRWSPDGETVSIVRTHPAPERGLRH